MGKEVNLRFVYLLSRTLDLTQYFLFGSFAFFLGLVGFVNASTPGNIDSCQELNVSGVYNLTKNLVNSEVNLSSSIVGCFNISVSNITLDCKGYYIRNITLMKAGIYAGNNLVNITIKNCNISMSHYGGAIGYGTAIYFNNVSESIIFNNSLLNNMYSIKLNYGNQNNISYNFFKNNFGGMKITNNSLGNIFKNTFLYDATIWASNMTTFDNTAYRSTSSYPLIFFLNNQNSVLTGNNSLNIDPNINDIFNGTPFNNLDKVHYWQFKQSFNSGEVINFSFLWKNDKQNNTYNYTFNLYPSENIFTSVDSEIDGCYGTPAFGSYDCTAIGTSFACNLANAKYANGCYWTGSNCIFQPTFTSCGEISQVNCYRNIGCGYLYGNMTTLTFNLTNKGLYTLKMTSKHDNNVTDIRNFVFLINNTNIDSQIYYPSIIEPSYGQGASLGMDLSDYKTLFKNPIYSNTVLSCGSWVQQSPEDLPKYYYGKLDGVNESLWTTSGNDGTVWLQRNAMYQDTGDVNSLTKVSRSTNIILTNINDFSNLNWTTDYPFSWFQFSTGLTSLNLPKLYINETYSSNMTFTYSYPNSPAIKYISNLTKQQSSEVLSATENNTHYNLELLQYEPTTYVFEANNSQDIYLNGQSCPNDDCTLNNVSSTSINLTVNTLGLSNLSISKEIIITVSEPAETSGSGSLIDNFWFYNVKISQFKLGEDYSEELVLRKRVKMNLSLNNKYEIHYLGVGRIGVDYVVINVSSESQSVKIYIGNETKFDLDLDGEDYDLYVKLNSILNKKANFTIRQINEDIVLSNISSIDVIDNFAMSEIEESWVKSINYKLFILFFLVLVIVLIVVILFFLTPFRKCLIKRYYRR